jgi:hypothetical protein
MRDWWVRTFDARVKRIPADWDDTTGSDVALQLPGSDEPTVVLSSAVERGDRPLLFCRKIEKARDWLVRRGVQIGEQEETGGTRFFTVQGPEGVVIEVCEEP